MILKDIGKRLKTFRKSNGYTQEQFSELLNMSLNFYGISKIGYVIHAFYVIIISDISISNVIALFQQTSIFNTIINSGYSKVIFSFVIKLFNLILFTISIFIFKKVTKESETFYWICFDIVSTCYLTISMAFVLLFPVTVYDPGIMTVFFFLAVFFLITSYIILYFFARLCEIHQKTHDDHIIRIKNKALTDYIELQNSYVEETHKLRHDIKNTISSHFFSPPRQSNISIHLQEKGKY